MDPEQSFCVYPFEHTNIAIDGQILLCCRAGGIDKSACEGAAAGKTYNIYEDSFDTIWKSQELNAVRDKILNGTQVPACTACYDQEKITGDSLRKRVNEGMRITLRLPEISDLISHYRDRFQPLASWQKAPTSYHLWLSNRCNYKCRMCSAFFSNRIEADPVHLRWLPGLPSKVAVNRFGEMKWAESEELFRDELFQEPESISRISFTGGEPFMEASLGRLLTRFIDLGVAKNIDMHFSTNGSIASDDLIRHLAKFRRVTLQFSIDGYGLLNEYIRHGSKWEIVHRNIQAFMALDNAHIRICPTVSAYNILDLDDLIDYCFQNNLDLSLENVLHYPLFLSFRALPAAVAEEAIRHWTGLAQKWPHLESQIRLLMQHITASCDQRSEELFTKFLQFSSDLDQSRGEELAAAAPALNACLKNREGAC